MVWKFKYVKKITILNYFCAYTGISWWSVLLLEENGVPWRKPPTCLYNDIRRIEHKLRVTSPLAIWEREREVGGLKKMCIFKYHRMVGQSHRNTSKGKTRQNLKATTNYLINFISWQISFHSKHTEMDGVWIYRAVLKDTNTITKKKKKKKKGFILSRAYTFCISSNELFTDTHTYNLRFVF